MQSAIFNHPSYARGKANVVVDALSRKEQEPPLRVRALVMTIGLDLPRQILNAQTKARKPENIKKEDVGSIVYVGTRGSIPEEIPTSLRKDRTIVMERIGDVAYKLDLPEEPSRVHSMFYVSNLKKCHADEPLAVPLGGLHFDDKLHFVEEPVEIVDHSGGIQSLRHFLLRMEATYIPATELASSGSPDIMAHGYVGGIHTNGHVGDGCNRVGLKVVTIQQGWQRRLADRVDRKGFAVVVG
nr:putative reverse transcriptase domain-containing protein [Tanacetum cinerariifolium]